MTNAESIFGKPIYSYTRAQAIEDGVLDDVSEMAKEAGLKFPVALTNSVTTDLMDIPESKSYQSFDGRLWDLLQMLIWQIRREKGSCSTIRFSMILDRKSDPKSRTVAYKAVCGPDDNMNPCITVMQLNES